jgi:hypothetical protein
MWLWPPLSSSFTKAVRTRSVGELSDTTSCWLLFQLWGYLNAVLLYIIGVVLWWSLHPYVLQGSLLSRALFSKSFSCYKFYQYKNFDLVNWNRCIFFYEFYFYSDISGLAWLVEALCYKLECAGSISDEVMGFFRGSNPSSHIMTQELTHPVTEMSTSNLPRGRGWPVHKADNLTTICEPIVYV